MQIKLKRMMMEKEKRIKHSNHARNSLTEHRSISCHTTIALNIRYELTIFKARFES